MSGRLGLFGGALMLGGVLLLGAGVVVGGGGPAGIIRGSGMMGGSGNGSDPGRGGMMGGARNGVSGGGMMGGSRSGASAPGPGEAGFVAGTTSAPRVVRIAATANLRFTPDNVRVQAGETIRFEVTTMGPVTHEFMVGPAADVAADAAGTPEVADISMMQTGTLTYTFDGAGPYAFACHAPGHYEAGMIGTIVVVN